MNNFNSILMGSNYIGKNVLVCGYSGLSLSEDWGRSWTRLKTNLIQNEGRGLAISQSGQYILYHSPDSTVYGHHLSTDYGANFTQLTTTQDNFREFYISESGQYMCYAIFLTNVVRFSVDYGANWTDKTTSLSACRLGAFAGSADGSLLFGAGFNNISPNYSKIYKSTDHGANWTQKYASTGVANKFAFSIDCSPDGKYVAASQSYTGNIMLYSSDYGETFTSKTGITGQFHTTLSMQSDGQTIYITTFSRYLYKSTNAGGNWSVIEIVPGDTGMVVSSVTTAPDGSVAYCSGRSTTAANSGTFVSYDGFTTWTRLWVGAYDYSITMNRFTGLGTK